LFCASCCLCHVLYYVVVLELYYIEVVLCFRLFLLSSNCIISGFVFCSSGCLCHVLFYVVVLELYYIWVCLLFVLLPLSCIILRCLCLLYWLSFVSSYIKLSWHCIISGTSLFLLHSVLLSLSYVICLIFPLYYYSAFYILLYLCSFFEDHSEDQLYANCVILLI
jgi:hypothetical protein